MKKPIILCVYLTSLVLPRFAEAQCGSSQCPPCLNNAPVQDGHGSSGGRKILNVYIDSSWDSSPGSHVTKANILNGVNDGIAAWNSSISSTVCFGRQNIGYEFVLNQAGGSASADVKITNGTVTRYCGLTTLSVPAVVVLPEQLGQAPETVVAGMAEHEFGHIVGLADAYKTYPNAADCRSWGTIMRGVKDLYSCVLESPSITSDDVAQANRDLSSKGTCQVTASLPQLPPLTAETPACIQQNLCAQDHYANPDPCTFGEDNAGCPYGVLPVTGPEGAQCCTGASPIIIDLSGEGFHLTSLTDGVLFDFAGTGTKVHVSWTEPGSSDAFLVLDRNHNGKIDSALEMFGNLTAQPSSDNPNGFLALAEYDKPENGGNNDGIIDARDAVFSELRLWQDRNHNGISEPDELIPLAATDIVAIDLKYEESRWTDVYGNAFRYYGRLRRRDFKLKDRIAYDVVLLAGK